MNPEQNQTTPIEKLNELLNNLETTKKNQLTNPISLYPETINTIKIEIYTLIKENLSSPEFVIQSKLIESQYPELKELIMKATMQNYIEDSVAKVSEVMKRLRNRK